MTSTIFTLAFAAISAFSGGTKPVDSNHFLLHGKIMEINPSAMEETAAENSQPIAKFQFESEYGKIAPDEDYSFQMSKRMRKCFKKIIKTTGS